jgi:hypothetical protein
MVRTTYRAAAMEWRTILSVGWLDNGFVAPSGKIVTATMWRFAGDETSA